MDISSIESELHKRGYIFFKPLGEIWKYENRTTKKLVDVDNGFKRRTSFIKDTNAHVFYCPGVVFHRGLLVIFSRYCDSDMMKEALDRFERM